MSKLLTTLLATVFAVVVGTPVIAADNNNAKKSGTAKVQSKTATKKAEGTGDRKGSVAQQKNVANKAGAAMVQSKAGAAKSEGANDRRN